MRGGGRTKRKIEREEGREINRDRKGGQDKEGGSDCKNRKK